jgi:hypothetical protein
MDAHSTQVLERLLAKELEPGSPEAQAAFAADAELLATFAELDELQAQLDLDAHEEAEVMALLDADAEDERATTTPPTSQRNWLVPAGLAVAASLAAWLLLPFFREPAPGPAVPHYLGSGAIQVTPIAPVGPGARFEQFVFEAEPASGSRVHFTVFDAAAPRDAAPLIEKTLGVDAAGTHTITWTLTRAEQAALPAAIRWGVELFDLEGALTGGIEDILAEQ